MQCEITLPALILDCKQYYNCLSEKTISQEGYILSKEGSFTNSKFTSDCIWKKMQIILMEPISYMKHNGTVSGFLKFRVRMSICYFALSLHVVHILWLDLYSSIFNHRGDQRSWNSLNSWECHGIFP